MKKTSFKSILVFGFLIFSILGCQSLTKRTEEFKLIAHKEEVLPNGMRILWIEDGKIPYFSMRMVIPVGSSRDPKGKEGLANMVASLLDKGTSKRNAVQIANDLERLGLTFAASSDADSTFIGISGLSIHANIASDEFFKLLTDSKFFESEIKRDAELTSAQIRKMFDNPKSVASIATEKVLFGNHPYASMVSGDLDSLKAIRRTHVLEFYKNHYQPNGAVLAVVGKFGDAEQSNIRKLFSSWNVKGVDLKPIAQPQAAKPQIVFVEKPGLKQAEIRMAHLGIPRNHPDYLKLRVANTILGESFIGRLFSEIREKRGLTYSIYSYFDTREVSGPFVISTFTRLDKIPEMIEETQKVYSGFAQGVSEADIKDAVSYLKGSFPQVIETGEDLARQLLILYRYGVDPSYLADFMKNISQIDATEVNEVLKAHFKPENLTIVVHGPPGSQVGLEKFGAVKKLKLNDLY